MMPHYTHWWIIEDINPEPWAVGPLALGRANGKMYPKVGPNLQLVNYQRAIKESIEHPHFFVGKVALTFMFWRQTESYHGGRKNNADSTNLQKALEDALQGILYENDRMVASVGSVIAEQGPSIRPCILIGAGYWDGWQINLGHVPNGVQGQLYEALSRETEALVPVKELPVNVTPASELF